MTVGPIPYTAMIDYINYWQIDRISATLLIAVVKSLDTIYMKNVNNSVKK